MVLYSTGDATCPVQLAWSYHKAVGGGVPGPTAEARHVVGAYSDPSVRAAEVVHAHTLVGPLYGTRFAARIVTTAHAPFLSDCGDIYRATSGRVALVAISHHQAASLDTLLVAAVIRHGIDVAAVPMGSGGGGYALFLGRMHPDKGVVHACHLARHAGLPLLIAAKTREPLEHAYFDAAVRPLLAQTAGWPAVGHARRAALPSMYSIVRPAPRAPSITAIQDSVGRRYRARLSDACVVGSSLGRSVA